MISDEMLRAPCLHDRMCLPLIGSTTMAKGKRLPFQHLRVEAWLNLALASLFAFYVFYMIWESIQGTTCGQIGVDFCDYWSAGKVASLHGYRSIYDPQLLRETERSILPQTADPEQFLVVPFLYLPVFILPFQLLSLLPPGAAFWIWTAFNQAGLLLYVLFFARRLLGHTPPVRLTLMVFAAMPVFLNVFAGQVGVWMAICIGEFMRALRDRRPVRAGLWLAGLLIKPQVLIILILVFVLHRAFRLLAGFSLGSIIVGAASLALVGPFGLFEVLRLWTTYGEGPAPIWVEGMMNWRMLGFHLAALTSPLLGYGIAVVGMCMTLAVAIYVWRQPLDYRSPQFPLALIGILAATTTSAWHSHIHTAMILIAPLIYAERTGILPRKVLNIWVFLPALLFVLVVFAPSALVRLNVDPGDGGRSVYFFLGAGEFAVNLYLLRWAVSTAHHKG